jgi:hypothetical protein
MYWQRRSPRPPIGCFSSRKVFDDPTQTARILVWQGSKQNGVEDAEDRGICAYAKGERQYGDHSEPWIVDQPRESRSGYPG